MSERTQQEVLGAPDGFGGTLGLVLRRQRLRHEPPDGLPAQDVAAAA